MRTTPVFKSFDQLKLEAIARQKRADSRPSKPASPKKLKRLEEYFRDRHAV